MKSKTFPYLEPHKVFAYLYNVSKARSPAKHIKFYYGWGRRFKCGWARLGDEKTVPCGLYGDETAYQEGNTDLVLAIYANFVLWRPASTRHSRFLLFVMRTDYSLGPPTLNPLYAKLTESCHWAFKGCYPDGTPLCPDGTRFLVTEIRGDLKFHKQLWGCRGHWSPRTKEVCFFCEARSCGDVDLYTDLSLGASWRQTVFPNLWEWIRATMPAEKRLCFLAELVVCF